MELSSIRRCFITYRECDANTDFPTLYSSLHFNQSTRMGGATESSSLNSLRTCVSIHAPARGATDGTSTSGNPFEFQSTHPHGVRLIVSVFLSLLCVVSIHAPARGATNGGETNMYPDWFQSTHPHGVRPPGKHSITETGSFNPRTRTGCDFKASVIFLHLPLSFNPRTRTGCDACQRRILPHTEVSIHAPARGATSASNPKIGLRIVSIHAPARGATPLRLRGFQCFVFQSTHPHGVRQ